MEIPLFNPYTASVLVKRTAGSSSSFGFLPDKRPIDVLLSNSIINIDKPRGPTSHQVAAYVQQIVGVKKAGHSGTLDPHVTGVLPIALGDATKIVQSLLLAGKEYVALMHLHKPVTSEAITLGINKFVGKIMQLPPVKSAVKRQWRERQVYYVTILEIQKQDVLFLVGCQAGTYIRKLIHDIGQSLGCGAHMAELRRTKVAAFHETTLCTLHDLRDALWFYEHEKNEKYIRALLHQVEKGVEHLAKIWVLDSTVDALCHGAQLKIPGISKVHDDIQKNTHVAIMTLKNELVATGTAQLSSEDILAQEKGIAVTLDRVFMRPGTYPQIEYMKKDI